MLASKRMSPDSATEVSSLPVGKTPGRLGVWLRRELTERGYDLQRGGQSQFARKADIHVSIISRVLNEDRGLEIDPLRRVGRALGYTLGEMLVHASAASAAELRLRDTVPAAAGHTGSLRSPGEALEELTAFADSTGKNLGEVLVGLGVGADELVVPDAMPPDPIIVEIEASTDISKDTKAALIQLHLENRARRFEEARLKRTQKPSS